MAARFTRILGRLLRDQHERRCAPNPALQLQPPVATPRVAVAELTSLEYKAMVKRIIIIVLVTTAILLAIPIGLFAYLRLTYYNEMHSIEKKLNAISGVTVVKIWGHEDIGLEEVTARLKIQDHGEMVLYGLSDDVFNYPDSVNILEIGGLSFRVFQRNSVGSTIDIGRKGCFSRFFPYTFRTESEVIRRYDEILKIVHSWPALPELLHFVSAEGQEIFLAVTTERKQDRDPIYDLVGVEGLFEFKNSLPLGTVAEKLQPGAPANGRPAGGHR